VRIPIRSRLRDLYRRVVVVGRATTTSDGDTVPLPVAPVQGAAYRAVLAGRNGADALYRGHAVGFDSNPGPRLRRYGRVAL
jgi:hypothetical protein